MRLNGPLYFGHPVNTYGTELESDLVIILFRRLASRDRGGSGILNPNMPEHQEGYLRYKTETGRGMDYFYEEVLPRCGGGAFLTFRDGTWGAGVYGEAKWFFDRGLPIWALSPDGELTLLDCEGNFPPALSIEETRERIRNPDGSRKPY